jgi:hypothetical protein
MTRCQIRVAALRARVKAVHGTVCRVCGRSDIELAHIKPTCLHGPGRGRTARLCDQVANPDCYVSLCRRCHRRYDRGEITHITFP